MTHPAPAHVRTTPDDQIVVTWPDGHVSAYPLADLRRDCPCAACRRAKLTLHRPRTVKLTRAALILSMVVLPIGLLLLIDSAETVLVSGPALFLVSVWLFAAGHRARYPWTRPLAAAHVTLCALLIFLVNVNHWGPRQSWGPFLTLCTPYVITALLATVYVYLHPPPTLREPSWHCRYCDYLLVGLSENRCPECGQTFDPTDLPATPPPPLQSLTT